MALEAAKRKAARPVLSQSSLSRIFGGMLIFLGIRVAVMER